MSYDVHLEDERGETVGELDANCTWNIRPMIVAASGGTGPAEWDGMVARDVALTCGNVISAFQADPAKFRAMNPANGWGSFEGCRRFIREIEDACIDYPDAILRVT